MKKKYLIFLVTFFVIFSLYVRDLMIFEILRGIVPFSSFSQYISLILLIWIILYFLFCGYKTIQKTIFPINMLKILIICSYIITVGWSMCKPLNSLSTYIYLILPFCVLSFSYSIIQRNVNFKLFVTLNLMLLSIMLYTYFEYYQRLLLFLSLDQAVSNSSYFLLYLLPILLCTNKKTITISTFIIVFVAVIMSAKRGGAIAISIGLLIYLIVDNVILKGRKYKMLKLIGLCCLILMIVYSFAIILIKEDIFLINRLMDISETGGTGRNQIWVKTIEMIAESDFSYYFIGHGYNQVVQDSPLKFSAHNDFLEIFYDFGIPIFILYIIFQILLIKRICKMVKEGSRYAAPLAFSYATFFVNSMVSHIFIYPQYLIIYSFVWGSILGLYTKELENKESVTVKWNLR